MESSPRLLLLALRTRHRVLRAARHSVSPRDQLELQLAARILDTKCLQLAMRPQRTRRLRGEVVRTVRQAAALIRRARLRTSDTKAAPPRALSADDGIARRPRRAPPGRDAT